MFDSAGVLRGMLSLVLLIIHAMPCHSQSPRITLYDEDEGLNRTYINCIVREPRGNIWLATESGIVKFDGSNFVEFFPVQGTFTNKEVVRLIFNGHNLYGIFRDSGLFQFNTQTYTSRLITRQPVSDICVTDPNTLYYTTKSGQLVKQVSGNEVQRRSFRDHGESLLHVHEGKLVASFFGKGMYVIDSASLTIQNKLDFISNGTYEHFESIRDTLIYHANDRVYQLTSGGWKSENFKVYPCPIPNASHIRLYGNETKFIIERKKNLYKLSNNRLTFIPISGIKNLELKNLFVLDNEHLLIGTNQGLLKINLKQSTNRIIDDNITINYESLRIRRKILETKDGQLLLTGHPYCFLSENDSTFIPVVNKSLSVYDAVLVGDDLFAATEDYGLVRISLSNRSLEYVNLSSKSRKPYLVAVERNQKNGDLLLGSKGLLVRYNPLTRKTSFFNLPDRSALIRYIYIDELFDRLWLGTEKGLFYTRYNLEGTSVFQRFTKLSGQLIGDLKRRQGTDELWVGHENGVEAIDLKSLNITHKVPTETFYNTRVTGILEDKIGRMWFSTYSGLVGYDPSTGDFVRLNKKNDLINLEFNYKACLSMRNGELIFGGLNGYDVIQPDKYKFERKEKSGVVSGIQVFSDVDTTMRMLNAADKNRISFNTDKEHLRIYLSVKNLAHADQYNYEFKLDDGAWTNTNRQSHIKIIKLDPGEYKLQMRAFNEYGVPVEFETVTLIAKQTFFKSRYFLGFLTILSFASLFSVLATFRRSRAKERELKESIAMDLHDEVGTILTRTLYIQNQTKPDDPLRTAIPKYLNEALFSLRVYIQTMHKESFNIRGLRDEIQDTLRATFASTNIKLEFHCNCKEEIKLDSKLYRDIKLCIYELANNILKHSNATQCNLELSFASSLLSIRIEDDGNLTVLENLENKGNGINNLRKRVERNAGTIALEIPTAGNGLITTISFKLDS